MKIKQVDLPAKVFTPIKLELTIESIRELEYLCGIFNSSSVAAASFVNKTLANGYKGIEDFRESEIHNYLIWKTFNDILKKERGENE